MKNAANSKLLRTLVAKKGGPTVVAYEAQVGHSTLVKLIAGTYPTHPRQRLMDKLCSYLEVQEKDLFPTQGKRSA